MNKDFRTFLDTKFKSTATIKDSKTIEVIAPDGELFIVLSDIAKYVSEDTRKYLLRKMECIFDNNFCDDKGNMVNQIWSDFFLNAIPFVGISSGNRENERIRIGSRIRKIRIERGIEARDLAKLADIDAANLSRIENGKYSVGIDILSKIAASLGKKIDLVDI